jgi:hypothetical protein
MAAHASRTRRDGYEAAELIAGERHCHELELDAIRHAFLDTLR